MYMAKSFIFFVFARKSEGFEEFQYEIKKR